MYIVGGSFNPDIAAYVKEFRNSLYKNYEMREQVRLVNVMKEIVVNRQVNYFFYLFLFDYN